VLTQDSAAHDDEETPTAEEQGREWTVAVNQAVTLAKQAGKVPAGVQRTLDGAAEAAVDWRELLRRAWSEATPADYSWMRPNRRHIIGTTCPKGARRLPVDTQRTGYAGSESGNDP
jgi:predicted metal-dependent peptidase